MDTLSSSVSTLKVPGLHLPPRELYHFKTPYAHNQSSSNHPQLSSKPTSISKKTSLFAHKALTSPLSFSSSASQASFPDNTSRRFHQRPATGYAVALLDIAQSRNSIHEVQRDVCKFSGLLRHEEFQALLLDPFVGEKEKGRAVKEVARKWKLSRYLVSLLTMLIERNRLPMVSEVLEEFERIYDEMSGTRVTWVSSEKEMEEDELFRIARRVQKLSGAVRVKVRNLVCNTLPLPAFDV